LPTFLDTFFPGAFTIVDVETTGMGRLSRICEIGAVRVENRGIVDTFETIVDPCVPITNSHIHGVTDSMTYGAPGFESVLPKLLEFTFGSVFVAHNAPFDIGMLVAEQERIPECRVGRAQPYVCTVRLGRVAYPGLNSYRLESLISALELSNNNPHEGLSDAMATAEVLIDLAGMLRHRRIHDEKTLRKRVIGAKPIFSDTLPVTLAKAHFKPRSRGAIKGSEIDGI